MYVYVYICICIYMYVQIVNNFLGLTVPSGIISLLISSHEYDIIIFQPRCH